MKKKVWNGYFAHGMENGLKIPLESGRRGYIFRRKVKKHIKTKMPEDWEFTMKKKDVEAYERNILKNHTDILIADLYHIGKKTKTSTVKCFGTSQEIGITKGANDNRNKQIPIIVIKKIKYKHPFLIARDVWCVNSLNGAAKLAIKFVKGQKALRRKK